MGKWALMDAWMDSHRLEFLGTWWGIALLGAGLIRGFRPRMSLADQVKHYNENREGRSGSDPEAGYADPEMALSVDAVEDVPDWMK